ncbi:hypothetical protein SAMN05660199_03651 [Klenkia soli]|uniref:Uncharacterized protein n=1 Tax=Klenkia soli TaxID=1052260 RepID=A0A1H0RVI9_9ACTN|nr:hypothetical protein [Klenkia soli]SDP33601.1 hypothetical protein SAMN05660199_03651 [Klenkia soli]
MQAWLLVVLASGLWVLGVQESASPALLATTVLAAGLLAALVLGARRGTGIDARSAGPVHTPRRDERCRRGSFRRQSHPRTPGRPLPRAPQAA